MRRAKKESNWCTISYGFQPLVASQLHSFLNRLFSPLIILARVGFPYALSPNSTSITSIYKLFFMRRAKRKAPVIDALRGD